MTAGTWLCHKQVCLTAARACGWSESVLDASLQLRRCESKGLNFVAVIWATGRQKSSLLFSSVYHGLSFFFSYSLAEITFCFISHNRLEDIKLANLSNLSVLRASFHILSKTKYKCRRAHTHTHRALFKSFPFFLLFHREMQGKEKVKLQEGQTHTRTQTFAQKKQMAGSTLKKILWLFA